MEIIEKGQSDSEVRWNILQCIVAGHMPHRYKSRRLNIVKILLKSGKFDANGLTSHLQNLLHLLVVHEHCLHDCKCHSEENVLKMVELFSEYKIDVQHKDASGQTAFDLARNSSYYDVSNKLKQKRRDIMETDHSCVDTGVIKAAINERKIVYLPQSEILVRAVINKDAKLLQGILNSEKEWAQSFQTFCVQSITKRFRLNLAENNELRPFGSLVKFSDWLLAIYLADFLRSREIFDQLYKFQKIVCGATRTGWTVLHFAMFQCKRRFQIDRIRTVEILLESGKTDVNASTNRLETVLHFASRCRCLKSDGNIYWKFVRVIRTLLLNKVDLNQRNLSGQTALMIACESGCSAAVHALLEWKDAKGNRLDINATNIAGQTALSIAEQSGNIEIVKMFKKSSFLNAVEKCGMEPAKIYLYLSDDKYVRLSEEDENLLCNSQPICYETNIESVSVGFLLNEFSSDQKLSLKCPITYPEWLKAVWKSVNKSEDHILRQLLEDNRFNCRVGVGECRTSILHLAVEQYFAKKCQTKALSKIKALLDSGKLDVNAIDKQNDTVLHMTCCVCSKFRSGSEKLAQLLLRHGADLNLRNSSGKTPLMLACENGGTAIVKILLNQTRISIDFDAVDNDGNTAFTIAKRKTDTETVSFLGQKMLLLAVENNNRDAVKSILFSELMPWKPGITIPYCNETKTSLGCCINVLTWKEAVLKADKLSAHDILELLLEYDAVVQSRNSDMMDSIIHRLIRKIDEYDDDVLRTVEILLESGRVNVNAININGETALHVVTDALSSSYFEINDDLISKFILLLLYHGANVNQKDKIGDTPLCLSSSSHSSSALRTILNWAEDTRTWLDLDAKNGEGQTALIRAALDKRSENVAILINAGASVNISDDRGYNALHSALEEPETDDVFINFGRLPLNLEEFRKRKSNKATSFEKEKPDGKYHRSRSKLNDDKDKTVKLLLKRSDINVNALTCEGYSPLDLAEAAIPEMSSSITNALKMREATLNLFLQEYQQSTSINNDTNYDDFLLRSIAKLEAYINTNSTAVRELSPAIRSQMGRVRDHKRRTLLHLGMMKYSYGGGIYEHEHAHQFFSFDYNVNETDIYGRTALHYADSESSRDFLLDKGASRKIKDIHGISALKMAEWRIHYEDNFNQDSNSVITGFDATESIHLIQSFHSSDRIRLNSKSIANKIWKAGQYAYRHPKVNQVTTEVTRFIENLASNIARRDTRFETIPILVGSSNEGTRLGFPDEFDFCFILTKISQQCEVSTSPELPPGFVQLKRTHERRGRTGDFDSFFSENQILNGYKTVLSFILLLISVLKDAQFIENQQNLDWDLESIDSKRVALNLKLNKIEFYIGKKYSFEQISIDIVPCFHIEGWWPDEAITNISPEIKASGCYLVVDSPEDCFLWGPCSEYCMKISFARAESDMIKQSSHTAKKAFMVGKQLIEDGKCASQYILKNCVLYCIEAFEPIHASDQKELNSELKRINFHLWLGSLMKCHLDFVSQDFCPSYFMPKFCAPINGSFKEHCMKRWIDNDHKMLSEYSLVSERHRFISQDDLEVSWPIPTPDPLFEYFDRKQFITELRECALKRFKIYTRSFSDRFASEKICTIQ